MDKLTQQAASSQQSRAIQNLNDKTQGLSYIKDTVSLSAPNGGKLAGKTTALTWDAQGNIIVPNKFQLGNNDLQTVLDSKQSKGDYVVRPEFNQYQQKVSNDLKGYQPKGDYALAADLSKLQPKGDYAMKGELAALQPKGNYAMKADLDALQPKGVYAMKSDLSGYAPVSELAKFQAKGDYALKSDLTGFAPVSELSKFQAKGDYAVKSDLAALQPKGDYAVKGDLAGFAPVAELAKFQLKGDYATKADLNPFARIDAVNKDLAGLRTSIDIISKVNLQELATKINSMDLSKYATVDIVNRDLAAIRTSIDTINKVNLQDLVAKINAMDLTKYASVATVDAINKDLIGLKTSIDTISKVNLQDLATKINSMDLTKYASSSTVDIISKDLGSLKASIDTISKVNLQDLSTKINSLDLTKYATKEDLKKYRELGFPMDLILGAGDNSRGDTGPSRALVKDGGGVLAINYGNDFKGGVRVDSQATVRGNLNVGDNVIMEGDNSWILHTPDDGRKNLFVAPRTADKKDWDWGKQTKFNADGSVEFSGPVTVQGKPIGASGAPQTVFAKPDGFDKPAVQIGANNDAKDTNIYSLSFGKAEGGTYTGMGLIPNDKKFFPETKGAVLGTHMKAENEWGLFSDGWNKLFAVQGGTGNVKVKGTLDASGLTVGGKPIIGGVGPQGPAGPAGPQGPPGPGGAVGAVEYNKQVDFVLGKDAAPERGAVGSARALVRDGGSALTINYDNDFAGGVNVNAKGGFRVAGNTNIAGDMKSNRVLLGDKWILSGVGDGQANDDWLRLVNKNGKDYFGGIAMNKLWVGTPDATIAGRNVLGEIDALKSRPASGFDGAMNDKQLRLRGAADGNHFVAYSGPVDGVRVQGHQGGQLGTNNGGDRTALQWNKDGIVNVPGKLCVGPPDNNWCLVPDDNKAHLNIVRNNASDADNQGFYRFSQDGNLFINRNFGKGRVGWIAEASRHH